MTFPHPQARCYCSIDPEAWGFTSSATSFGKAVGQTAIPHRIVVLNGLNRVCLFRAYHLT